jgi:hypothetical protein
MACALLLRVLICVCNCLWTPTKVSQWWRASRRNLTWALQAQRWISSWYSCKCNVLLRICLPEREPEGESSLSHRRWSNSHPLYDDVQTRSIAIITRSARNSPVDAPAKKNTKVSPFCVSSMCKQTNERLCKKISSRIMRLLYGSAALYNVPGWVTDWRRRHARLPPHNALPISTGCNLRTGERNTLLLLAEPTLRRGLIWKIRLLGVKKITLLVYCPACACWLLGRLQKMLGNVDVRVKLLYKVHLRLLWAPIHCENHGGATFERSEFCIGVFYRKFLVSCTTSSAPIIMQVCICLCKFIMYN